ncbi:MAG: DMT family transporter [Candidatus Zixiibacteriota bacterium]
MDSLVSWMKQVPFIGEIFALMTAFIWAVAVIFFKKSGETVHPIMLNLFKNSLASVCILITMLVLGIPLFPDVPGHYYIILIIAGALGIGIADTLFFVSLNHLGASISAIVACTYSPSMIILSIAFLGEKITALQIAGTSLIIMAFILTANRRKIMHISKNDLRIGITTGILSQVIMAIGVIMTKRILDLQNLLWTSEVRFVGGLAILVIITIFHPNRKNIVKSLFGGHKWTYTIAGSFAGAYMALVLWLAGMKYARVSIAAVLNQTSEIFIFILAAIFLNEAITKDKTIAIILAFIGAVFVTISHM